MAWGLTLAAFGVYFDYFNPNTRYSEYYHRHEFYHYYLGSKYFKEVGYTRLYECTAVAEIELGRGAASPQARHPRPAREPDQADDRHRGRRTILCIARPFQPERWEAFKKDVDWFYNHAAGVTGRT